MRKRYFACSFDDGLQQDRRIVELLKEYRMGGTFHLNSGLMGKVGYTMRIGNLGLDAPECFDPKKKHLLPFVGHHRLTEEEARQLYNGFEVASHTVRHHQLICASKLTIEQQIISDVQALSALFNQPVIGFAYPYGIGSSKCKPILQKCGVMYARTALPTDSFSFPKDPYRLPITTMCLSKDAVCKVERFIAAEPKDEDLFFLFFTHGYELDFGTKESNWSKFRHILEMVSAHEDIVCCSIADAIRMHNGLEPLLYPMKKSGGGV